jgi:hypothetical protein
MPIYKHRYGILDDRHMHPREVEMAAFRWGWDPPRGGLGRYEHFRRYCKDALPNLEWNDWLIDQFKDLTNDEDAYRDAGVTVRNVPWTGPGASGKSFSVGTYAVLWFRADPMNSIVTLVSTSMKMSRRRVWPIIHATYSELCKGPYAFGNMIDSQSMLQCEKGNSTNAISCMAVESGELSKTLENLKGLHAARILLVIDEAPGTPDAIFETIPNMRKGCQDLTVVTIGNPISHLDNHGKCCEPKDGWRSVNVESDTWKTKEINKWRLPSGRCRHFDGWKSPNVRAGKTVYPYLFTYEDFTHSKEKSGGEQTIQIWSQERGFWCPEGTVNSIFSETLIEKYDGRGKLIWQSTWSGIGGLDPAFGGDDCTLRFAELGDLPNGRQGIQLKESLKFSGDPESKDELDYQIARWVIRECDKRGIRPDHFGADATGTGRGVFAILRAEWGDCLRVEFGGSASDKPATSDDSRPSSEVYDRRVTELWYAAREFVLGEQLKGLCDPEIIQFCSREYTIKTRKYVLDTKGDCKKKIGRSPDDADAVVVLVELARTLGASSGFSPKSETQTDSQVKKWEEVYDEDISKNEPVGMSE